MKSTLAPWANPAHENNGPRWLTGKKCIDCDKPAGTAWSPLWCQACNEARIIGVNSAFKRAMELERRQFRGCNT